MQCPPVKSKRNLSPLGARILPLAPTLQEGLGTGSERAMTAGQKNARSRPPCMPSAASGPREEFGSSAVKIEGMNDARNQKWEEKKCCKVRTDFSSAALYFEKS